MKADEPVKVALPVNDVIADAQERQILHELEVWKRQRDNRLEMLKTSAQLYSDAVDEVNEWSRKLEEHRQARSEGKPFATTDQFKGSVKE